jgi:hypothetical protein
MLGIIIGLVVVSVVILFAYALCRAASDDEERSKYKE